MFLFYFYCLLFRPLPTDFITYARMDSHYLLNCYDHLRIRLATKEFGQDFEQKTSSLIESVFSASLQLSYKVYKKIFNFTVYRTQYKINNLNLKKN